MKNKLKSKSLYWATFERFETRITGQAVVDCTVGGRDAGADCRRHLAAGSFRILRRPGQSPADLPALVASELKGCGAWSPEELQDHEMNLVRLLWIAAGNVAEDETPDKSRPVGKCQYFTL